MPRMTLIMRLERIKSSINLLDNKLDPTQISVYGSQAHFSEYWISAGSRTMSRWLEIARKRPFTAFRCSIPLHVKPADVVLMIDSTTSDITSSWNWSTLVIRRNRRFSVFAGLSGKRYFEMLGIIGCRDTRPRAFSASASVYGLMSSNSFWLIADKYKQSAAEKQRRIAVTQETETMRERVVVDGMPVPSHEGRNQ